MDKLAEAFDNLTAAEETKKDVFNPAPEPKDDFKADIQNTATSLLGAIKKKAAGKYELEPDELSKLTKAVCDLQNTFYGKEDKGGNVIMANNLSMFKGMLK